MLYKNQDLYIIGYLEEIFLHYLNIVVLYFSICLFLIKTYRLWNLYIVNLRSR